MSDRIYKTYSVQTKAIDPEQGIYEAMISTEDVDRDSDIMIADGANLKNYLKNPVVLFGHNYHDAEAVVGKALNLEKIAGKGIKATWQFASSEVSQEADLVRRLWAGGFLNATSIGFIPTKWEPRKTDDDEELQRGRKFLEWELLEFSIVPVPANQNALRLAMKSLEYDEDLDLKVAIPYRDEGKADEGESWSAPTLGSFTSSSWGDLSDGEKRRIARHYTFSANMPPENFGDLKLPHHKASTSGVGPAVWRGVAAAMGRMMQAGTQIPDSDKRACYNHLAKHYRQFDKEPPEMRSISEGDMDFQAYSEQELKDLFDIGPDEGETSEPNTDISSNDASEDLSPEELDAISDFINAISEDLNNGNQR